MCFSIFVLCFMVLSINRPALTFSFSLFPFFHFVFVLFSILFEIFLLFWFMLVSPFLTSFIDYIFLFLVFPPLLF